METTKYSRHVFSKFETKIFAYKSGSSLLSSALIPFLLLPSFQVCAMVLPFDLNIPPDEQDEAPFHDEVRGHSSHEDGAAGQSLLQRRHLGLAGRGHAMISAAGITNMPPDQLRHLGRGRVTSRNTVHGGGRGDGSSASAGRGQADSASPGRGRGAAPSAGRGRGAPPSPGRGRGAPPSAGRGYGSSPSTDDGSGHIGHGLSSSDGEDDTGNMNGSIDLSKLHFRTSLCTRELL